MRALSVELRNIAKVGGNIALSAKPSDRPTTDKHGGIVQ